MTDSRTHEGPAPELGTDASRELAARCSSVEAAYEFTLSYAAQGRTGDAGTPLRRHLEQALAALEGIEECCRQAGMGREPSLPFENFAAVVGSDARHAQAALALVLAQPSIGSGLMDSLNASIHLRALLADLFLLTEILHPR